MKHPDAVYDNIGTGYNNTRRADPYLVERIFQLLLPKTGGLYLDAGCGTGNYTIALAERTLNFYGVEPSGKMLETARLRAKGIKWVMGEAESLPFDNKMFDGVIATLTIHHWADLKKAFVEIHRVLKEGGRLVIFTATPEQMKGYWLNHYFPEMLANAIKQMPSLNIINQAITNAGLVIKSLENYEIRDDLQDLFLYAGKNNPKLYMDNNVLKGISSFSVLANNVEIEEGLSILKKDIECGRFDEITEKYKSEIGDYLFITAARYN